jgi:hypothetical protein
MPPRRRRVDQPDTEVCPAVLAGQLEQLARSGGVVLAILLVAIQPLG